ncbi:uridine kinase [Nocardioides fonticola]|uniref:uridine kinase n=1 Tax=Nocardioides fonticola TaxID=450363 RepID=UPI0031D2DCCE
MGLDGRCGSGKTTLARELVARLRQDGVPATHLDSDGFHHVRAVRYRQGRDSARGYYDDAYDLGALADRVLGPLGPGGSGVYATRVHDMATDAVITDETATAGPGEVVVLDCTFLQRGALRELWDVVVWLEVPREVALARGIARDAAALGGEDAARAAYESRYMAACDLYLAEERPAERADIVVDHADPERPVLLRG